MIDAADREKIEASRNELHNLLDKPQLQGIPVSLHTLFLYLQLQFNIGIESILISLQVGFRIPKFHKYRGLKIFASLYPFFSFLPFSLFSFFLFLSLFEIKLYDVALVA